MKVIFLSPAGTEDAFFGPMIGVMEVTAERLGISLEILACGRSAAVFEAKGRELCRRTETPEYLLLVNENETGVTLLPELAAKGYRILTLSQGFSTADRALLGKPRTQYPNWLGELVPDDCPAGFRLAETLIAEARAKHLQAADGKLHMLAVSGPFTTASILRLNGLRAAVSAHPDVVLEEVAPAGWSEDRAFTAGQEMLRRVPQASMVWAANDTMALGATRAVAELRSRALRFEPVLIGGVDWSAFVPDKIRSGEMTVSMGGHFFDGAWALLLLHDYHRGVDFPRLDMQSHLSAMHGANVDRFDTLLRPSTWRSLDLSRFSRALHPANRPFEIAPETLLQEPPRFG